MKKWLSLAWHPNPKPLYNQDLILISASMDRTIYIWSDTTTTTTNDGNIGDDTDSGVWAPISCVGSAGGILGGLVGSSLLGFLNVIVEPIYGRWIMGHAYGGALHFFSFEKVFDDEIKQESDVSRSIEEQAALIQWKELNRV